MRRLLILIAFWSLAWIGSAAADPCEAIPEDGPMPAYLAFGATFSGPVVDVLDGDSMCVAVTPDHQGWVEVRLADFYAPELKAAAGLVAKAALTRIALGKTATCVAGLRTYDRVAGRCWIDGRPLGDMMRDRGIAEGGRGTRAAARIGQGPRPRAQAVGGAYRYRTCAEARRAGAAPMHRGDGAYNPNLDGDNDGVSCEPPRRR